jgi:competence protein ComEA
MSIISSRLSRFVVSRFFAMSFALLLLVASSGVLAASVDINTANANTLATELIGIGAAKAEAIVAYREANGPFKRLDELLKVKGVGKKTLEQNRAILVIQKLP